jgi:hypothetical protein
MASDPFEVRSITDLVAAFRASLIELRDPQTSEAVVRQEYIDPFWKALGWDVANHGHRSYAEKDVLIEARVGTVEGERARNRRPDYLFRIDGFPRFVVEAKKPAVDLRTDKDSIFQAKTYAWSAQIPFAILTDFEEFRLFDTTIKPYLEEPSRGLVEEFDLRFEDYVAQWDVLRQTFGREAVAGGSLERLLAKLKRVRAGRRIRGFDRMLFDLRGTEPVDQVFLKHLEDYRLRFAREIYRENRARFREAETRHGAAELAEATQRLIDRLVFMRVCEDRGIISYGTLRGAVENAAMNRLDLYDILRQHFREFDARFNGYLFKAHFSEGLSVSAELLADFMRSLYLPEGPYRFDAIGDDLLGIIYERFLGSSITVERGAVAAKEKPEVRHAGGVYYTPRFVVDTIIRRVVAPKVEGKTPLEVRDVKILDPACGSGSFLIAAFQYLVDYCCQYVTDHPGSAEVPASPRARSKTRTIASQNGEGRWLLTPDFKAELLTSCIHGVDIDAQAVEVSIMSLYLKTLENMPEDWQRGMLEHTLLPPLDNNIRCGNSLLSQTDFDNYWDEKNGSLFPCDSDVAFRINAFDWSSGTHGFGRVFATRQGFDCIIGNPPYIRVQELNRWAPEECEFYKWRYNSAAKGNYDIYVVFIERALQLLADDGLVGFICPHKFWQATYGEGIRKIIAEGRRLRSVIDFTDQQVFRGGTTYTAVHVLSKWSDANAVDYARVDDLEDGDFQCQSIDAGVAVNGVTQFTATHPRGQKPWSFVDRAVEEWCNRIVAAGIPLGTIADVFVGVQTSADKVFHLDVAEMKRARVRAVSRVDSRPIEIEGRAVKALVSGEDVRSYQLNLSRQVIIFPYEWLSSERPALLSISQLNAVVPNTLSYLRSHEALLRSREGGRFDDDGWYRFGRSQNLGRQKGVKLCIPRLATRIRCAFDEGGEACLDNVDVNGVRLRAGFIGKVDYSYLCGVLNSRLADSFIKHAARYRFRGGFSSYNKQFIEGLPIKIPEARAERKLADQIVERVERVIEAKKQLQKGAVGDRAVERLQREIEAHEQRIDELVCRLYGVDEIPESG